jgi:hypothetical protein
MNPSQLEAFVLKLNNKLEYVYFRTFQGPFTESIILTQYADVNFNSYYAHMKSAVSVSAFEMRVISLNYLAPGSTLWYGHFYNPS